MKKPPFVYSPPPTFRTKLEEDRYWENEIERFVNGYNGLTGRHYAYLTIGKLKTVDGSIQRPVWRDGDQMVFENSDIARRNHEDEMIVKRREFGLTSIFGGLEPIYNCIVNPGSVQLLTSADVTRVQNMFTDKTMIAYNNLPKALRPPRLHERSRGYLHLGEKDEHGDVIPGDSQVHCISTADSDSAAKSVETFRAMSIFLDELFLHPRASIVLDSSQACVSQGFNKKGHIVFGGSCGAQTEAEAEALRTGSRLGEELWNDAQAKRIRTTFIPGWMCISQAPEYDDDGIFTGKVLDFCPNGYSDEKKATEWILAQRGRLEKAKDKSRYYNFIKNYPLTIEEVFEINSAGIMPQEVYMALNDAKKHYFINKPEKSYSLRRISQTGEIVAEENAKGKFMISRLPQEKKTYISGTDPIPFGQNQLEKGSDYAISIKCREDEEYVAYYAERDLDSSRVIDNAILLQEFYRSQMFPKGAPTMMESNRGEVAMKEYSIRNKQHLLAHKPRNLGIIYEDKKTKFGWYSNDKTDSRANNYLIQFLKNYADRIALLRLIEESARFPKGNLDLIDAVRSCEIFDADFTEGEKKKFGSGKRYTWIRYVTRENGKTVEKWVKKEIR